MVTSRCVIASPDRTSTNSAACSTGSTTAGKTSFSSSITSRTRRTARRVGRVRCARVVVITKHTRGTARRLNRTCITANGSARGRTRAWKCMGLWRRRSRRSWRNSINELATGTRYLGHMKHLKSINQKAHRIENDVVALQQGGPTPPAGPHIPLGCSFVFSPGWEVDSQGGTAGLCQPVERDLFDCHLTCFWPAHVPDLYNFAPDWTAEWAVALQSL